MNYWVFEMLAEGYTATSYSVDWPAACCKLPAISIKCAKEEAQHNLQLSAHSSQMAILYI